MTVKVKPLVWRRDADGDYLADHPFGCEAIVMWRSNGLPSYEALSVDGDFPTLEAAKAAAQADYEARILAALEAPPAQEPVAWRVKDPKHGGWWIYFPDRQADGQPLYTTPQPDETPALRAKLAEVEADRDCATALFNSSVMAHRQTIADRDEERKLADDLAECGKGARQCIIGYHGYGAFADEFDATLAAHAARRKE